MRDRAFRSFVFALCLWGALPGGAVAFEKLAFRVRGDDTALTETLQSASLLYAMRKETGAATQDVLGAALADYRVLVEALYAAGYYGGTVAIRLDGAEASGIDVFAVPSRIDVVRVVVDPGPLFMFGTVSIGPEPPNLAPDPAVARDAPALSQLIALRAQAVIDGWRAAGHPKAAVAAQSVVADHARRRLDVAVRIDPGPTAVFGKLIVSGDTAVRKSKIERIAGLKSGAPFSPAMLDLVATRLRRVGAFSSVVVAEAGRINPDGSIDVTVTLSDRPRHRYGFGAEYASVDGLTVSGFWLDRNLFGGAEQFRIDAEVTNIGAKDGGADYTIGARVENPSRRRVDTTVYYELEYSYQDEPNYLSESWTVGAGYTIIFDRESQGRAGFKLTDSTATDDFGTRNFTIFSLPVEASLDRRDNPLDPGHGYYLEAGIEPFFDFANSVGGARGTFDARAYRAFGEAHPVTLAARAQVGTLVGPGIEEVQPEMLFFSGGGGTVRGQAYQSLGVDLGGGVVTGGLSFLGLSGELRTRIKGDFGAAVFADAGYIGEASFGGDGGWHAGAGLGMRYFTSLGPFRADLAWPVGGDTSGGMQLYIGIGQAF